MSTPSTRPAGRLLARVWLGALLAAGALAFAPPPRAAAMIYTVNTPADGPPVDDGFDCTLREAIIAANGVSNDCGQGSLNPDVIQFNFAGTITLSDELPAVDDTLTITGGGAITIHGADAHRIFTVNGGKTLTLNGLTLTHAFAESGEGGAIRSFGSLYVNNTQFLDNHANAGGGALYSFGVTEIHGSQFISNTASVGGAILNPGILLLEGSLLQGNQADVQTRGGAVWSSGPLIIQGSQFIDNQAGAGGAIYARRAVSATTLSISGAAFEHNLGVNSYPDGNGGALHIDDLHTTIQSSTFTDNGAQSGGAIYVGAAGVLTLTHSTLRENTQTTNGAGLYNLGAAYLASVTLAANAASHGGAIDNFGLLFLTNVTLSGNEATYGGGLKNEGSGNARLSNVTLWGNAAAGGQGGGIMDTGLSTQLNLTNVIVADSPTGGNCTFFPPPDSAQWSLSSDDTCGFGLGRNNVSLKLNPLASNGGATQTHMPQLGSPAIDNGTDDDAPSIDQRGVMRPQGVFYDVGAVEVMPGEAPGLFYLPLILR